MSEDDGPEACESPDAVLAATDGGVEAYETEHGVVLYDADNPLAWIESRSPVALDEVT